MLILCHPFAHQVRAPRLAIVLSMTRPYRGTSAAPRETARRAPKSLHLLEQMIEGAAHFEFFLAALHMHYLTAAEVAADLLDGIDANHGGAMDLPEFVRVQFIDQLFDRLADQGRETPRLHSSVFVLGAEE